MPVIHKSKGDEYYTPKSAWEDIMPYLPKDKIYHEPFNNVNNPKSLLSKQYLSELGLTLIEREPYNEETNDNNFFDDDGSDWDICISNPPFSIKQTLLKRLKDLDKPFVLILPTSTINTGYFKDMFKDALQIIIPRRRINFNYYLNVKQSCCFDCLYICYKMNLSKDLIIIN